MHLEAIQGVLHMVGGMIVGVGNIVAGFGSSAVHTLDCVLQPHIY